MGKLSDAAIGALEGRNNLQSEIRNIVDNNDPSFAADIIAKEVGVFRSEAQPWIQAADTTESIAHRRKQVNNIINDISRICRDSIGKSIVLVSRKGGYTYDAIDPKPRAKPTTFTVSSTYNTHSPSGGEILAAWGDLDADEANTVLGVMISHMPIQAMRHLLGMGKEDFINTVQRAKTLDSISEG